MKKIFYITTMSLFALFSCQKNKHEEKTQKNFTGFLDVGLSDRVQLYVGKMNSVNDSLAQDFEFLEKEDTIFVFPNFLESDNFDGKQVFVEGVSIVKPITVQYNIALHFNGTEKANKFIPLNYLLSVHIKNASKLLTLKEIENNRDLLSFFEKNNSDIKELAYKYYLQYYESFPENELRSCCLSDLNTYNRLRKITPATIASLNLQEDLKMSVDYSSVALSIENSSTNKVVVFSKTDSAPTDSVKEENPQRTVQAATKNVNWKGVYSISAKAKSLYDGQEIDLLYSLTLEGDKKGLLSIGAEQVQDYWCEGEYSFSKTNNILHARGKCNQDDADDFFLKHENNNYYIKSKRFVNKDWQLLTKVK